MAEETNPIDAPETAAVSSVKKQRAPRAKKADATASALTAEPVKKNRGGRPKRADASAAPASATATNATRVKRAAASGPKAAARGSNRAAKPANTSSPLTDDLADLLRLEEENQRLRKSLAEKLRAENADLRSRLGLK